MYILCINSGDDNPNRHPVPEKGVVYSATRIHSTTKKCGRCGSRLYYEIPSVGKGYIHSECMFDILPNGFLTNLSEIKQTIIIQKEKAKH